MTLQAVLVCCIFMLGMLLFAAFLFWLFPDEKPQKSYEKKSKPTTPTSQPVKVNENYFWKQKPKVVDYSTDPDAKMLCIYVSPDAILNDKHISANSLFTENAEESSNIKLLRSGTGFRVYNHPTIKDGQWLSCRR